MTSDAEKSFKSKLRAIAKEKNRDPADLWQSLTLERFLVCYPKEFIFAEKLETIVNRGSFNSRMKDFHDLYSMTTSPTLASFQDLEAIIRAVFEHRKTKLALPILKEDDLARMPNFWNEYLRTLRAEHVSLLPENLADLISKINEWLQFNTRLIK